MHINLMSDVFFHWHLVESYIIKGTHFICYFGPFGYAISHQIQWQVVT